MFARDIGVSICCACCYCLIDWLIVDIELLVSVVYCCFPWLFIVIVLW